MIFDVSSIPMYSAYMGMELTSKIIASTADDVTQAMHATQATSAVGAKSKSSLKKASSTRTTHNEVDAALKMFS
eukprot:NODE_8555_length_377_cov_284.102484.p1 GENE.NODE_8555_length_377_cov_284.102484~~NODE_8555_length_377_cov_284.102484.p1  ORF type:complete len:74 (-),score=26.93 NODE_8555_length_377_cov_284.102484:137-358(-)